MLRMQLPPPMRSRSRPHSRCPAMVRRLAAQRPIAFPLMPALMSRHIAVSPKSKDSKNARNLRHHLISPFGSGNVWHFWIFSIVKHFLLFWCCALPLRVPKSVTLKPFRCGIFRNFRIFDFFESSAFSCGLLHEVQIIRSLA